MKRLLKAFAIGTALIIAMSIAGVPVVSAQLTEEEAKQELAKMKQEHAQFHELMDRILREANRPDLAELVEQQHEVLHERMKAQMENLILYQVP